MDPPPLPKVLLKFEFCEMGNSFINRKCVWPMCLAEVISYHHPPPSQQVCHSPNGGPSFVVNSDRSSLDKSVRCECHVKVVDDTTRRAKIKLVTACLVALLFMIGEVIGKFFRWSLTSPGASCMRLLKILCRHSSLCAIISCVHPLLVLLVTQSKSTNSTYSVSLHSAQKYCSLYTVQEFKLTSYMGRCV